MNRKRAVWISVLLYFATFIAGVLVAITLGTDFSGETQITGVHWLISIVLSVILAALFSLWYFKGKGISVNSKEGLHLGLMFLVVGIIIDLIILIPYLAAGVGDASVLVSYYLDPLFWISVLLVVLTPVVVGKMKEKKKRSKRR